MPAAPLVIFTPPSSSTPTAPGVVYTPPSGGGEPTAPGVVYTPPSGGGEPAAPGVVYTLPSDGSVAATLTVNPTGADNSVLFTAVTPGTGGNAISVEYAAPGIGLFAGVTVVANAITITPANRGNLIISGASTAGINGVLIPTGTESNGKPVWSSDGTLNIGAVFVAFNGIKWSILKTDSGGPIIYQALASTSGGDYPDGLDYNAPTTGTGTPTVTAGTSSAAQVIAAVIASTPAAALVTASASGTVTGAVAAVTAANLSGGSGITSPPVIFTPPG